MKGSSLYIHIPFCISKCAYCDFFSLPLGYQKELIPDAYIEALINEIKFRTEYFNVKELNTIYIGGGTPSLLSPAQLKRLFTAVKELVSFNDNIETTVEVNPDDVSMELLESLVQCGVNRISCGIQSMNEAALKKACRRSDSKINSNALKLLSENWKGELSIDLISGLPCDDEKDLLNSIEKVLAVNPSHLSLYSLTIEENTPFGKMLESGKLLYDYDKADKLWLAGRDYLESKGYTWYEVSNFCRPGKECRHNLVYWTHGNYLGCGSGAAGSVYDEGKEKGSGLRWTNTLNVSEYIDFWQKADSQQKAILKSVSFKTIPQNVENIDLETSEFEFFMMGLRKLEGVSQNEFEGAFGHKFPERFVSLFTKWEEKGLCLRYDSGGAERFAMSREGMLFLNRFNMELL